MISTIRNRRIRSGLILLFWLFLWQAGAWLTGNQILFVGPFNVLKTLVFLAGKLDFWRSIAISFQKISFGFFAAFFAGISLGWLSFFHPFLHDVFAPIITFIKSVPVASFVILALIWMGSKNLSVLISFLVVFPVIYVNTISGLKSTDEKLLEMAKVFHMTPWRKFLGLYWPALLPYLTTGCKTALGMSWKSGIAAEVIGVPEHTIGEQLYFSKIYLSTAELFAWTLVIILVSALFEQIWLKLLRLTEKRLFLDFLGTHSRKENPNSQKKAKTGYFTLTIQQLSKRFHSLTVLDQLTLTVTSKQPCCIMGPSGSGKTTLLRILLNLESADSGWVKTVHSQHDVSLDNGISNGFFASAVFQENRLCESFSPIDNIRLAIPGLSKDAIMKELSCILPEECFSRPVSTLSGGMKRRVAILRALLATSSGIIMDEPFTGLDEETKSQVIQYILEKSAGKMLILSTHQEEDAALIRGKTMHL